MTFQKIKSGIPPFDDLFQGLYLGRPTLLSGKRRSGTSTLALRFLSHVLRIGEKILLFTEDTPDHVTLDAHGLGTDIPEAIKNDQLSIVPYDRHLPLLPFPEALDELRGMVADRHYSFIVFDPVMPWLAVSADRIEERLNAFFGLLEETSATSVLILRHPVSPLARRLSDAISERCAIYLNLTRTGGSSPSLEVSKYMGAPPEKCPVSISLGATVQENDSPILSSKAAGMTFQELQKATQRLQVNISPSLLAGPLPASTKAAAGFPSPPSLPPRQGKPRAAERQADEPALAPLPLARPHASASHAAPHAAPHATPHAMPHAAPHVAPPPRAPAMPPPRAAAQAPALAPMPSPFHHSHEAKASAQPISLAHILDAPEAAPRAATSRPAPTTAAAPAAAHPIRFSDAEPAATRPREPAPAPSPAPRPAIGFGQAAATPPREPAPAPSPVPPPAAGSGQAAAPEHAIRFSDVIQ